MVIKIKFFKILIKCFFLLYLQKIKMYLKLTFYFLLQILINNWGKLLALSILISCFLLRNTFEDTNESIKIVKSFTHDGTLYNLGFNNNNSSAPFKIFEGVIKIDENGFYNYKSYNSANLIFWFGIIISFLFFIIWQINDQDTFDFSESFSESLIYMVDVEYEDNVYYYICLGRLLGKSVIDHGRYCLNRFNVYTIKDIKLKPKFETRKSKRKSKLSKLGIN